MLLSPPVLSPNASTSTTTQLSDILYLSYSSLSPGLIALFASPSFVAAMDAARLYAVVVGSIFIVAIGTNLLPTFAPALARIDRWASRHLRYSYVLDRHQFLGPWTRAQVLIQLVYIALNVLCLVFRDIFHVLTIADAGQRAGTMALINMIPLFAGLHLTALSDALGTRLATVRLLHRSASLMASALALFHILICYSAVASFDVNTPGNLFATVVSVL